MTLRLEQPDVGQDIYMYFSVQGKDVEDQNWDIARCHVKYDGNVNLPFRFYEVTDHMSLTRPYYGGLDKHLQLDKYQNWGVNQRGSNSTCPG